MDEKPLISPSPSPLNHFIRRLRYQGTTQWVTLILGSACIWLFLLTTPLSFLTNVSSNRNDYRSSSFDGTTNELGTEEGTLLSKDDPLQEAAEEEADLIDESIPEFTGDHFWEGVDWDDPLELPDKVAGKVFEMQVETGEEDVEVKSANGDLSVLTIYYRESLPANRSRMDILLLHGSRFNSETWVTVDTTKTFAAMGYRTVAIDLPGFGKSAGQVMFGERAASLLDGFITAHELKNPVIIAPSMSGGYALPFIMSRPHKVGAFVALAPTSTERFKPEQYKQLQIPVLSVYGTKDATFGNQITKRLNAIPNYQTKLIQDAHHAVYLDQPDEWHRVCYIFLRRLDAWRDKIRRSGGAKTTEHPPIVTSSLNEETTLPEQVAKDFQPPARKDENGNYVGMDPKDARNLGDTWLDVMKKTDPVKAEAWMKANKVYLDEQAAKLGTEQPLWGTITASPLILDEEPGEGNRAAAAGQKPNLSQPQQGFVSDPAGTPPPPLMPYNVNINDPHPRFGLPANQQQLANLHLQDNVPQIDPMQMQVSARLPLDQPPPPVAVNGTQQQFIHPDAVRHFQSPFQQEQQQILMRRQQAQQNMQPFIQNIPQPQSIPPQLMQQNMQQNIQPFSQNFPQPQSIPPQLPNGNQPPLPQNNNVQRSNSPPAVGTNGADGRPPPPGFANIVPPPSPLPQVPPATMAAAQ